MSRRRLAAVVGALAVVAPLAACGGEQEYLTGAAYPDWAGVDVEMELRVDEQLERVREYFRSIDPFVAHAFAGRDTGVAAVVYQHVEAGDRTLAWQSDIAVVGDPPAIVFRRSTAYEGMMIDFVHYAGDSFDYVVVGDAFLDLAPSRWVAVGNSWFDPYGARAGQVDICTLEGFEEACEIVAAIAYTEQSEQADLVRRDVVVDDNGGVQVRTQITLESLIEEEVLDVAPEYLSTWTEEALQSLLPTTFWLDPSGALLKIEVNGVVPLLEGENDMFVQLGFESVGVATSADIPEPPARAEVTILTAAEWTELFNAMDERVEARRRADREAAQ